MGIFRNIIVGVEEWSGKTGFSIIHMDDNPLVLSMEFLTQAKFVTIPHLNMVLVIDEGNPCCAPILEKQLMGRKELCLTSFSSSAREGSLYAEPPKETKPDEEEEGSFYVE